MGTGILYAVIVLAWAVYLIPIVRAHRRETATTRSTERFADAMRVLGKRSSGPRPRTGGRLSAPPPRTRPRNLALVDSGRVDDAGVAADVDEPRPTRRRISAASRRRRALAAIVAIAVVLAVLAYVGMVEWWSLGVPAVLLVAFVVIARVSLRHQRAGRRQQPASVTRLDVPAAKPARRRSGRGARRVEAGQPSSTEQPAVADPATGTDDLGVTVIPTGPQAAGAAADGAASATQVGAVAGVAGGASDDAASAWLAHAELDRWDPVPVTLPTYVDKEQAQPRSVRTIDLSGPDAFSAGRLPEAELLTRSPDESVDELVERAEPETPAAERHGDDGDSRVAAG